MSEPTVLAGQSATSGRAWMLRRHGTQMRGAALSLPRPLCAGRLSADAAKQRRGPRTYPDTRCIIGATDALSYRRGGAWRTVQIGTNGDGVCAADATQLLSWVRHHHSRRWRSGPHPRQILRRASRRGLLGQQMPQREMVMPRRPGPGKSIGKAGLLTVLRGVVLPTLSLHQSAAVRQL